MAVAKAFTIKSVHGPYIFGTSGTVVFSSTVYSVAGTGLISFDGAGHLTGNESFNLVPNTGSGGSQIACQLSLSGTYTVNPMVQEQAR